MNELKVHYFRNKLVIDGVPSSDNHIIESLWSSVREDYTNWVADVHLNQIENGKSISESMEWKGMSTWWLIKLAGRDSFLANRWLHRLMMLYLCRMFSKQIEVHTDDKILARCLLQNIPDLSIIYQRTSQESLRENCKLYYPEFFKFIYLLSALTRQMKTWLLLFGFCKRQCVRFSNMPTSIWFRTLYPANWIRNKEGSWSDRHFMDVPLQDKKYNRNSNYLVYITKYSKDQDSSFFSMWKQLRILEKKFKRKIVFPEAHLKITDILEAYFSTLVEWACVKKWQKKQSYRDLFVIDGMLVFDIIFDEWESSYWGALQYNKLHGLAIARFLEDMKNEHFIITYGELFIQNRSAYYLSKITSPRSRFIAIQHAMNAKNKMFTYFRKSEFNQGESKKMLTKSPEPDFYLCQGEQYRKILGEFLNPHKLKIIGVLKYDSYFFALKNIEKIKTRVGRYLAKTDQRRLLIATSIDDYEDILNYFIGWDIKEDWSLVLSPHPATDVNKIIRYQKKILPNLNIKYITEVRTFELMTVSDLLVTGFSTSAIEAGIFGLPSVRLISLGAFPQFDLDKRIPTFYDSKSFFNWFNTQKWDENIINKKESKDIASLMTEYFYSNDGKAAERMWEFINSELALYQNPLECLDDKINVHLKN